MGGASTQAKGVGMKNHNYHKKNNNTEDEMLLFLSGCEMEPSVVVEKSHQENGTTVIDRFRLISIDFVENPPSGCELHDTY